jgi:hypothetical protein
MDDFSARLLALRRQFGDPAEMDGPPARAQPLGDLVLEEAAGPDEGAALFRSAFRAEPPRFPRHFVARHLPTETAVAYVHYARAGPIYLAGGLVVNPWSFRRLAPATAALVRERGGIAQWAVKESCDALDTTAVFAYMGDRISIKVNTRVGFVETGRPHLYVYWRRRPGAQEREALIDRIAAFGAF